MAKVYVGCALTGAPKEFVDAVEISKRRLREAGHEVADFVGVVNGTAFDVYETDIHKCVAECEFMIAICDLPSIGLGWELAVAVEKLRKPTLALAHQDTAVSRLRQEPELSLSSLQQRGAYAPAHPIVHQFGESSCGVENPRG